MLQQVNLYKQLKKPIKILLSLEVVLMLYALFILFLFLNSIYPWIEENKLNHQVYVLTKQLDKEEHYLNQVKAKYPLIDINNLNNTTKDLKQELSIKNQIFIMLSHQVLFSDYLIALGNAVNPGVWLVDIKISNSGEAMLLKGSAAQANLVQQFIELLHTQPTFSRMEFHLEELEESTNPQDHGHVDFSISAAEKPL